MQVKFQVEQFFSLNPAAFFNVPLFSSRGMIELSKKMGIYFPFF